MGRKSSQPMCPTCGRAAIIDDAGKVAFHTRSDGSFYCNPRPHRPPKPESHGSKPKEQPLRPTSTTPLPAENAPQAESRPVGVVPTVERSAPAPSRTDWVCGRCGKKVKDRRTLCVECRRKNRAAGRASTPQSEPQRVVRKSSLHSRGRVDPNRSWILERARDALMAGLGHRKDRAPIKDLRSRVPALMAEFEASLPDSQRTMLRTDLAARKFLGKNALTEFGQSVVADISRQRQANFRRISSGGLPGTRR